MRLGVSEREHGGVASMLGPPLLFHIPGHKACVRTGGRLAPRGPVMTEPPWAAGGRRDEGWAQVWWNLVAMWQFLGGDATVGP